jgi:GAF domain-containing protein
VDKRTSMAAASVPQDSYENLLPRLGDYLLQHNLISPDNLLQGLQYQEAQLAQGQPVKLGQALVILGLIEQPALDQAVIHQILDLHAALQASNRQLEERVHERTQDLERRLLQIRTAAEITQFAISAPNLEELVSRTVNLIIERFGYYSASIYLLDESGSKAILIASAGPFADTVKQRGQVIEVGSRSMVGWVASNNQSRVSSDVRQEFFYHLDDLLTDTMSEACVPISASNLSSDGSTTDRVGELSQGKSSGRAIIFGVLDIQHNLPDAFDPDVVAVLQTVANHIASVLQNLQLMEIARQRLNVITTLFKASYSFTQAKNDMEVYAAISRTLKESLYPAAFYVSQGSDLKLFDLHPTRQTSFFYPRTEVADTGDSSQSQIPAPLVNLPMNIVDSLFMSGTTLVVMDFLQPNSNSPEFFEVSDQLDSSVLALIPVKVSDRIHSLFVLGIKSKDSKPAANGVQIRHPPRIGSEQESPVLDSFMRLAQLTSSTLENLQANEHLRRQTGIQQALSSISQLISTRTTPNEIYRRTHEEIIRLIGKLDFIVAIYDSVSGMIQIPYMVEIDPDGSGAQSLSIPPFPLGQGLTSLLLKSRQPLMLNFDAENQARQLGALVIGKSAKSWLGVPLLFAGEPVGAIIIQDRFREGRFNDDDLSLVNILAALVAISIRNEALIEDANKQAERERMLLDISQKMHNSVDIQTILQITATELQKALMIQRAKIEIDVDAALQSTVREFNNPGSTPQ